ncbi:hypothetical protein [Cupriavidus basilensis]|uniref:hypothetical protein n=1 Tax=Cupriavidus basilensis TaxID=68895 RepID=UPI0020A68D93|nr:hypothetical protein [Cupriavidus basilensis]MCP3017428.1 hypothetical protein [Cupriavidus basilensis]
MMDALDVTKIQAEIGKLMAETVKLNAEADKLQRETRWYPVIWATAWLGAVLAVGKFFFGG